MATRPLTDMATVMDTGPTMAATMAGMAAGPTGIIMDAVAGLEQGMAGAAEGFTGDLEAVAKCLKTHARGSSHDHQKLYFSVRHASDRMHNRSERPKRTGITWTESVRGRFQEG